MPSTLGSATLNACRVLAISRGPIPRHEIRPTAGTKPGDLVAPKGRKGGLHWKARWAAPHPAPAGSQGYLAHKKPPTPGPYGRPIRRALCWSQGAVRFFIGLQVRVARIAPGGRPGKHAGQCHAQRLPGYWDQSFAHPPARNPTPHWCETGKSYSAKSQEGGRAQLRGGGVKGPPRDL